MNTVISIGVEHAAYVVFMLTWAVYFFSSLTYRKIWRLAKKQQNVQSEHMASEPVSVIITAHNQAEALLHNLPSILEQHYPIYEVVVVNNASTDHTEDVLKNLELKYPHLRHTFIPAGTRYLSPKRLALTIGIKAAKYEWLLFTEADSRPVSAKWIATMARHFHPQTQIVLGYANYEDDKTWLSHKTAFFNLYHQQQYLPWAIDHKAYRCNPANFAYRKSLFMEHKGFADDVSLIGGTAELLVNRHSTKNNTEVSLRPESHIVCKNVHSNKDWKTKRSYYMETRRHFIHTWNYRFAFNFKQNSAPFFYLVSILSTSWCILNKQWIDVALILFLFTSINTCKSIWFNQSTKVLGEQTFPLSFLWFELAIQRWNFCSWLTYWFIPRSRFYRKAF